MSFFDKMKTGLNQVKDKAQQTVEATKISTQISSKRRERTAQLAGLGEMVHEAFMAGNLSDQVERIDSMSKAVLRIDGEIELLEQQLVQVKGEKVCSCGAVVPAESKFCHSCGKAV